MGVGGTDLLLHFTGNGVHFLQLVLRFINRNLAVFLNPFSSDSDLHARDPNRRTLFRTPQFK